MEWDQITDKWAAMTRRLRNDGPEGTHRRPLSDAGASAAASDVAATTTGGRGGSGREHTHLSHQ